jgi:hypothetical protein
MSETRWRPWTLSRGLTAPARPPAYGTATSSTFGTKASSGFPTRSLAVYLQASIRSVWRAIETFSSV